MPEVYSLLAADEPVPVTVHNENGLSPFLIFADHGGNVIPRTLHGLEVSEAERRRHIAWDIGIAAVFGRDHPGTTPGNMSHDFGAWV